MKKLLISLFAFSIAVAASALADTAAALPNGISVKMPDSRIVQIIMGVIDSSRMDSIRGEHLLGLCADGSVWACEGLKLTCLVTGCIPLIGR